MIVAILNRVTAKALVEDEEAFNKCTNGYFKDLDVNGAGVLSRSELRKGFDSLLALGKDAEEMSSLYDIVFEKSDSDHSGTVDISVLMVYLKPI
ncbi:hypothetical protein MKX01_025891 [Papaver californicum]|nr:hypothetical protein MKX01_025891 [Papaver californicum]